MRKLTMPLLILMLTVPLASAQNIVFQTQMLLSNDEVWQSKVSVSSGKLFVQISTGQANINMTIYQDNATLLSVSIGPEQGIVNHTISVSGGEIVIVAFINQNLLDDTSEVNLFIEQLDSNINGIVLGLGVILVLLLPVFYYIGRKNAS